MRGVQQSTAPVITETASVKPVRDEPASCLTGSGTNLLRFKTCQVPVTHSVDDTQTYSMLLVL